MWRRHITWAFLRCLRRQMRPYMSTILTMEWGKKVNLCVSVSSDLSNTALFNAVMNTVLLTHRTPRPAVLSIQLLWESNRCRFPEGCKETWSSLHSLSWHGWCNICISSTRRRGILWQKDGEHWLNLFHFCVLMYIWPRRALIANRIRKKPKSCYTQSSRS